MALGRMMPLDLHFERKYLSKLIITRHCIPVVMTVYDYIDAST